MKKIMIVDDEKKIVEVVKSMLESEGFEVITALSGGECLNKLKTERPDYILLDIEMPEIDGWETLRAIKGDESLKSIPVAVLGAKPLSAEIMERKEMEDITDYITKPFTKKDLIETIKQIHDL